MAILGKIRQQVGLLVFIIALAILAFLLMDVSSSGLGGQPDNSLGYIDGEAIPAQAYEARVQQLMDNYRNSNIDIDERTRLQVRETAWQQQVEETLAQQEFEALGLDVSSSEFEDMMFNDPPASITSTPLFQGEDGKFSADKLKQYVRSLNDPNLPDAGARKQQWIRFENSLTQERVRQKYTDLVKQSLYVPEWQAKLDHQEKNKKATIDYVQIPYASIDESEISFSDADLKQYIKENKSKYDDEAARTIEYVAFPLKPSAEDTAKAKKAVTDVMEAFQKTKNEEQFLKTRASETPFDARYFVANDFKRISLAVADTIDKVDRGAVIGPFQEGGNFKIAKLIEKKLVADSAKVRLIAIVTQDKRTSKESKKVIDSLKAVLDAGADFESLASAHSEDGSKENGGNIDYVKPGQFPAALDIPIFYEHGEGDLFAVELPGESWQLIEILEAKRSTIRYKVGFLTKNIEPSKATRNATYRKAASFAGANKDVEAWRAAAKEKDLEVRTANNIDKNTYIIPGLSGATQDITTWAFNAEVGAVGKRIFAVDSKLPDGRINTTYVSAVLTGASSEGKVELENVRSLVETEVKNEKKAAKIIEKIGGTANLAGVAQATGETVKNAASVGFNDINIKDMGQEPKVQAAILGLEANEVSKPIVGNRGVYVVQVKSFTGGNVSDLAAAKTAAKTTLQSTVTTPNTGVFGSLSKSAEVEDNRYKTRRY